MKVKIAKAFRRGGRIHIIRTDKTGHSFESLAQLREETRDFLDNERLKSIMFFMLVAWCLRQAPDGSLLETLEGKEIDFDLFPILQLKVT